MSACLLDNEFVKQELHLCDKSKIFPYFEWLNSLEICPKVPSVIVLYLWTLMFLGGALSVGYLCVLPCWVGIEPQFGGVTFVYGAYGLTLDWMPNFWSTRFKGNGSHFVALHMFLCTMAHASAQRGWQRSLSMNCVWLLSHEPGHRNSQGILLAIPKLAAQAEDQRDVQRKL